MNLPAIFITRPLPEAVIRLLESHCRVDMWPHSLSPPPMAEKIGSIDGLITYGHDPVNRELIESARRLRVISVVGVGYDHVDVAAARDKGMAVGHTPGVLTDTTAELAFALLLSAARNVTRGDRFVRRGDWTSLDTRALWGRDLKDSVLGIVGLGRIGQAVARHARAFGMTILYSQRQPDPAAGPEIPAKFRPLEALLSESDFVSLHVPLTPETFHLIGREQLNWMKPESILINTARGAIVHTAALVQALSEQRIAGAALDVTDPEPLPADHALCRLENVVLCPHLGSASERTRFRMMEMAVENLLSGLKGEPLPFPVPETTAFVPRGRQS